MASGSPRVLNPATPPTRGDWRLYLAVVAIAASIYLGCILSPPSLMDDVDAVQAQIGKTMLVSGDWVTARLDGVVYLEKAPLIYWAMAFCYKIFGVADWVARIPVALSAVLLALLAAVFGTWAFGKEAGFYAGICIGTCMGLFLFTRVQIPDVMLTGTITLALWAFLRALDPEETHPPLWAAILAASLGVGLLLKSLIGLVFPLGGFHLSGVDQAVIHSKNLATTASGERFLHHHDHRGALARFGGDSQPARIRMDAEKFARPVSWIFVVLLHQ